MDKDWMIFIAAMAWPTVGLLVVLVLGPFGLLEKLVTKLSSISTSVDEFKRQVADLKQSEGRIKEISDSLASLRQQIDDVHARLGTVQTFTKDLLQESLKGEGEAENDGLAESASDSINSARPTGNEVVSARYLEMEARWSVLCELLKKRIGPDNFDGRSIAYMAQRLGHGNRKDSITKEDAEMIAQLSSKMKRFRRLQTSKDEWLDEGVFQGFINGVAKAMTALQR